MYSKKSERPRMDPWVTPALTTYSCENFPSRTTQSWLLLRKEEIRPNIWPEMTSMPNSVESLGYIKCYSLSIPRPVKTPSNSIILKSSASMYESSGSQFFRTTTGIQWGPDAFDESRFVMTFLTILGVLKYHAV